MTSTLATAESTSPGRMLELEPREFQLAFGQWPLGVSHLLVEHPLLTIDAIADLADRFAGRVERHRADLPTVLPEAAPELEGAPSETVRGIEHNGCWMVFWYLEQIPEYKELLDSCIDEAEEYLPRATGRTCQREAFLFLSAPNAITPVHFDPEHNFLLQIKGRKEMNVCPFPSAEARQRALDRYFDGADRNLDAMPGEGETFVLTPGRGVYVPSFMPHWVKNGPEASISLSITFRTRESRRAERVHRVNARLRGFGLSPRPAGASSPRDRAKESFWIATLAPRRGLGAMRRTLGRRNGASISG